MVDLSISPDTYGKLVGGAITLALTLLTYIARQAHNISDKVGKVSRTLFGEDGAGGINKQVDRLDRRADGHENRLIRIETHLGIEERREFP